MIGWRSLRDESSGGSHWHSDARRFEVATSCVPLCSGLSASLELLASAGSDADRLMQIQACSRLLWQGLQAIAGVETLLPEPPSAGLVSFTLEGISTQDAVQALGEQQIWIRRLDDPDCLRACTHITTSASEVERLLEAITKLI